MFDLVHAMRTRIICSPSFDGDRILGAILFEQTMNREVQGRPTARFLWEVKHIVPFLKVDKGLAEAADGAQIMKPIPDLDELLERAVANRVFGTKMRSVITGAEAAGVGAVVGQQFDIAHRILDTGLVPIIEPEIDIHSPQKSAAETLLLAALIGQLDRLDENDRVMIKLTPPETDDLYAPLSPTPGSSASWRCPGATPGRRPTPGWPVSTGWSPASRGR